MQNLLSLGVKLFADGADKIGILEMNNNPLISGFTTNPTLMRKAGVTNYKGFALDILSFIKDKPISFEVFSDDFSEMYDQALEIASWGKNVYVKIPVTNTQGKSSAALIEKLARENVQQNVTALLCLDQVQVVAEALKNGPNSFISLFAGRVADTGRDPIPYMKLALEIMQPYPQLELIWASPRELLNIFQANSIGCHVITATNDILKKLSLIGKDLSQYSLETVQMFYNDAVASNFRLETNRLEVVN